MYQSCQKYILIVQVQGKEFTTIQYGINIIVGEKNFLAKEKTTNNFVAIWMNECRP